MAIPHISVQLISRGKGRSAVAAAAYRAAEKLADLRLGKTADFSRKQGVVHTEILAPEHAAPWMRNRATLWNGVEAAERRKDAQVAREVQVALPRDLGLDEQLKLLRVFVQTHFVDAGMVADFAVHLDNPNNPHAHIMLTTREIVGSKDEAAFGPKARGWNAKDKLLSWREGWAVEVNRALARNGIDQRIDHRSYGAQGIALEPTPKIGVGEAHGGRDGRDCIADRIAAHDATVRRNGEAILAEPAIALIGITQQRATFTRSDMGRYLHTYTADAVQFQACLGAVMSSPELVRLVRETPHDPERFTTRAMLAAEQALLRTGTRLAGKADNHSVSLSIANRACFGMDAEPRSAVQHVLRDTADIAIVEGYAGAGKSRMLRHAKGAWEQAGYRVLGGALSGKAAEGLEISAGIAARSLASWEHSWNKDRETLRAGDVFVIDEAGMVGTRQMQRVLERIEVAGAKAVLVGDTQQLQAIEAGAPMRALADAVGHFAMVHIQRQRAPLDQRASVQLAQGRVREALEYYTYRGAVLAHADPGAVVQAVVGAWDDARRDHPDGSSIMLAYRKADVTALNEAARAKRQAAGEIGQPHVLQTARGKRVFASGDRVYFLRNDRGLEVKNGSLGTITGVRGTSLQVRMDATSAGDAGREVAFDTRDYPYLDHGYAATVHKAQGVTVDRAYVMASPHFDRHIAYVALTRHREQVQLHYSCEDFKSPAALSARLSRTQTQDMALDYGASVAANTALEATRAVTRQAEHEVARNGAAQAKSEAALRTQAARLAALTQPHSRHTQTERDALQQAQVHPPHNPGRTRTPSPRLQGRTPELPEPHEPRTQRDITPDLSAAPHARSQAEAQARTYAACQARIEAYRSEALGIRIARAHLPGHAPKSAASFQDTSRAMQEARAACARAQQDKDDVTYTERVQGDEETRYRAAHPVRAALGLEAPRQDWAERRARIAAMHAAADARLVATQKAREALPHDPAFVRSCQKQADASQAAYVQRQQAIEARAAALATRAPAYAADQKTVRDMDQARAQRDARLRQYRHIEQQRTQAHRDARTPVLSVAQAIDKQPAVVQARAADAHAQRARDAARQQLQRAESAQQAYDKAHPIKAAFGVDDGARKAVAQAQNALACAARDAMYTRTRLEDSRAAPETRRGAEQQAAAHNAGIEAARTRVDTLTAALTRHGDTYRADQASQKAERDLERTQERGWDKGRDWGMER